MLLGLHGPASCGKDTVARLLVENYGFVRFAFADTLKDALSSFFGIPRPNFDIESMKEVVDQFWGLSPRQLMQRGGKAWRVEFGQDIFIKRMSIDLARRPPNENTVISDVRLGIEAEFLREYGGRLVHLSRAEQTSSVGKDETERRLPISVGDIELRNDGNLLQLSFAVKELLKAISPTSEPTNGGSGT